MKKILFIITILVCSISFAQSDGFKLIKNINGLEIYSKLTKTKSSDKNDYWIIEFEYINKTSKDLYYQSYLDRNDNGKINYEDESFCGFYFEQKKSFDFHSNLSIGITGEKTKLLINDGSKIMFFKKNKIYTKKMDCKLQKGIEPILSIKMQNEIELKDDINSFL